MFGKRKGFQPKGFVYKPRFYDPKKEEFEGRVQDAMKRYHNEDNENYKVGNRNFDFRNNNTSSYNRETRFQTNYGKASPTRILVLIALLAGICWLIYRTS